MRFLKEENGASAVEYGIILGLVVIACMIIAATLGHNTSELFSVKVSST
jgi:pilus assembly protein Flp/PilA